MCQWCIRTRTGKRRRRAAVVSAHLQVWKEQRVEWTYFVTYSPPDDLGLRTAAAMHGWWRSILEDVLGPTKGALHVDFAWWSVEAFQRRDALGRLRVHLHGFLQCPRIRVGTWRRLKELFWSSGAGRLRCSPLLSQDVPQKLAYALKYMLKEHRLGRYTTAYWPARGWGKKGGA